MKTKTLFLGLFFILGIFIAGCAANTNNAVTDNNDISDTQLAESEEKIIVGTYILDTESSTLMWSASRIASSYHTGKINLKSGILGLAGDASSGEFVIDMTTISSDENIDSLVKHLKSPDFFNVEQYPESKLAIKSIRQIEGSKYNIVADLTILNITNEINFDARLISENNILSANAEFAIDRTKWEIKYGSGSFFKDLGDKTINDEIVYNLELKFNLEE